MSGERWTDAETAKARQLIAEDIGEREFFQIMKRSKATAKLRLKYLDDPAFRLRALDNARQNRKDYRRRVASSCITHNRATVHADAPEDVRRAAAMRLTAARSITAWVFGDPPPGFSALDRREQRL